MENFETIAGIPTQILSKSFPGVHLNLFKFLFRNVPVVKLERIETGKVAVKIEPELPAESDSNCIHLGEIQISDLKVEKDEDDTEDLTLESICDFPDQGKRTVSSSIKQESQTATSSEIPEVKDSPESDREDEDFSEPNFDSESSGSDPDYKPTQNRRIRSHSKPRKNLKIANPFQLLKVNRDMRSIASHYIKASLSGRDNRKRPFKGHLEPEVLEVSDHPLPLKESEDPAIGEVHIQNLKFEVENLGNELEDCLAANRTSEEIEYPKTNTDSKDLKLPSSSEGSEFELKNDSKQKTSLRTKKSRIRKRPHKPIIKAECKICSKSISSKYLRTHRHKQTHLNPKDREKPFKCSEKGCEKSYLDKKPLISHIKIVHNPDELVKIKCDICYKSFVSNYNLKIHKLTHLAQAKDRERPFKCTEVGCGRSYLHRRALNHHIKERHMDMTSSRIGIHKNKRVGDFTCATCGKNMIRVLHTSYLTHKRNCLGNQMCEFCPKIFNSKKELGKHRNSHTKEKRYECRDCESVFYRSECLRAHMRFHLKERPFPCTFNGCTKSFVTKAILNRHIKESHAEEKKYQCPYCPQKYKFHASFAAHVKSSHKKERNCIIKCDADEGCEETFITEADMQKHKDARHGGNKKHYICSKCGKAFASSIRLSSHEGKYCKLKARALKNLDH